MPEVNIYIETDSVFQGKTDRKCGYVLSAMTRHGEKTKEGFGHLEGTYHQTVLITLAEALERMAVPCHICVHTKDVYVASRILKLEEMAGSDWMDSKGKQIKNTEEWRRIYQAVHALPETHKLVTKTEKHSYSSWIQEEMIKRTNECKRIMGEGLEPPTRTEPKVNGMPGYHY